MRKWIFSTQSNAVVSVACAFTFLFLGDNTITQATASPLEPVVTVMQMDQPVYPTEALKQSIRFQRLLEQWHEERGATSSITQMAHCDSYIAIMAMGKPVIPLIVGQLRAEGDQPDMWFWALRAIAEGVDPVNPADRGNMGKMAAAWLEWWSENPDYAG